MRILSVAILCCIAGFGCSGKEGTTSNSAAPNLVDLNALDAKTFGEVKNIPANAKDRIQANHQAFVERTKLVNYVLNDAFKENLDVRIKLLESRNKIVLDQYFDELLSKSLTDEAVEQHYEKTKDEYAAAEYKVEVLSLGARAGLSDPEALEQSLAKIQTRITAGESFEQIAQSESQVSSIEQTLSTNNMAADIKPALDALAVGDVSTPVKINQGFSIFKLIDKQTTPLPLSEVRSAVEYKLKQVLKEQEYSKLLNAVKAS